MKKILIAVSIVIPACVLLMALRAAAGRGQQQLRDDTAVLDSLVGQLADVQAHQAVLTGKVHELRLQVRTGAASGAIDPALADFLRNKRLASASPAMQDKILAQVRQGGQMSRDYTLVTKAALGKIELRPLRAFPDSHKLTDAACGVLAITPEEREAVEAAFAQAFAGAGVWAKANVQRDGPSDQMLCRYTLPADTAFEQASTERLFTTIKATLGKERSELMFGFFQYNRIYEDGGMGSHTNILEVYRIPEKATLGYRSGWKMGNSEAINTNPEPIDPKRFPAPFSFVFPGGWQEVAQREGFTLPEP